MPLVKTLIVHHNPYGTEIAKAVGDEYEVPAGEEVVLVDQGLVEVLGGEAASDPAAGEIDAGE